MNTNYTSKKINDGYVSLFRFLAFRYRSLKGIERVLTPFQVMRRNTFRKTTGLSDGVNDNIRLPEEPDNDVVSTSGGASFKKAMIGALQPLYDIKKGIIDFTKPYKSARHITRDIAQPLHGLKNLLVGVVSIPVAIVMSIIEVGRYSLLPKYKRRRLSGITDAAVRGLAWITRGLSQTLKGIFQLATTPVSYVIRIPMRLGLTAQNKQFKPIEDNSGLQSLIERYENATLKDDGSAIYFQNYKNMLLVDIHIKAQKAIHRGQKTQFVDADEEQNMFDEIHTEKLTVASRVDHRLGGHGTAYAVNAVAAGNYLEKLKPRL